MSGYKRRRGDMSGGGGDDPGASAYQSARAFELAQRLAQSRKSSTGGLNRTEAYEVVPDPKYSAVERSLINRWRNEFVNAEGRAGEDQVANLNTGPRKTIKSLDNPLRFKSSNNTQNKRKSRFQRQVESGDMQGALTRVKMKMVRGGRYKRLKQKDMINVFNMNDFLSTQCGLKELAAKGYQNSLNSERKAMDVLLAL